MPQPGRRPGGAARKRPAARPAGSRAKDADGVREQLLRLLNPLDAVVLTRERLQEAIDDAVERGRMTRTDATDLVARDPHPRPPQTEDLPRRLDQRPRPARRPRRREVDRARRATGLGSAFPISGYDDLTAAQVAERLGDLTPARAAQGARLRAAQREPQVGARGDRARSTERPPPAILGGCPPPPAQPPARTAPPAATSSTSRSTRSPTAATASPAARTATSSSSPARIPGDRVRARVGKAKRAYAEARAIEILEPSPDRIEPGRRPPRRAVAGAALRAPARGQARAGRRRADAASAGSRASSSSRSSPPSSSGATATSSSTRSATGADGELVCGFHAPGRFDRDRRR